MKTISSSAIFLGALALAACNSQSRSTDAPQANAAAGGQAEQTALPAGQVHSASGDITELSDKRVTISQGPIESIGWPAMTMTYEARDERMLQGLNVGDPVNFQFQKAGQGYVLRTISRAR